MKDRKLKRSISVEIIIIVVVIMIILNIILSGVSIVFFSRYAMNEIQKAAIGISDSISQMLNGEKADDLLMYWEKSRYYEDTKKRVQRLCDNEGYNYIYIVYPDLKKDTIRTVFSVANLGNPALAHYDSGFESKIASDRHREIFSRIMNGESTMEATYSSRSNAKVEYYTGYAPVYGIDGTVKAVVCTEVPANAFYSVVRVFLGGRMLWGSIITLVVILILYRLISVRIINPIKKLTSESHRFSETREPIKENLLPNFSGKNEIGQLSNALGKMEHQIVEAFDRIVAVTAENERNATELDIASKLQLGFVPNTFPAFPDRKDFDVYAYMKPAREVGGDFYDYFLIDDNHLALVAADVCGKGITAALFMMCSRSIVKSMAIELDSPERIIERVNRLLCEGNSMFMFVTVWLGIVTLDTGHIDMVNAGHEDILVGNSEKGYKYIRVHHDCPLGIEENAVFTPYCTDLERGDKLLIYTDGVVEANDREEQLYGEDRLMETANRVASHSCQDLIEGIKTDLFEFISEAPQFDDITLLCFERK